MSKGRLWGGRFEKQPDEHVLAFMSGRDVTSTPPYDESLIHEDIWVNRAHTLMLVRQGIIPRDSAVQILEALRVLEDECGQDRFHLDPAREDVHTNIEAWVTERIGIEHAGHLHTGRSRNDQVLTDMRMYMRGMAASMGHVTLFLVQSLIAKAEAHTRTYMPGFTHHQHATPTTLGHVLIGYAFAFLRDTQQYLDFLSRWDQSPLGSVASYGTTLPIDRQYAAELLGFSGPEPNTVDTISSRWEAEADLAHICATAMTHLSSLAQTLILFSTREVRCVRIPDEYSSGSSIMPQKRNPQTLETIKALSAQLRAIPGTIMALGGDNLFGYNTDQMWTKYLVIDALEGAGSLAVMRGIVDGLTVDESRLAELAGQDFLGSTALVEALVRDAELPFRVAKMVVEEAVAAADRAGEECVTRDALASALANRGIHVQGDLDALVGAQDAATAVERITHVGGPGPTRVEEACAQARGMLDGLRGSLRDWSERIGIAYSQCCQATEEYAPPAQRQ